MELILSEMQPFHVMFMAKFFVLFSLLLQVGSEALAMIGPVIKFFLKAKMHLPKHFAEQWLLSLHCSFWGCSSTVETLTPGAAVVFSPPVLLHEELIQEPSTWEAVSFPLHCCWEPVQSLQTSTTGGKMKEERGCGAAPSKGCCFISASLVFSQISSLIRLESSTELLLGYRCSLPVVNRRVCWVLSSSVLFNQIFLTTHFCIPKVDVLVPCGDLEL